MPLVPNYHLSKDYRREFYALARAHLRPGGYLMIDAPKADCTLRNNDWAEYSSTLVAAGFTRPYVVISRITLDAPPLRARVDAARSYSYHDDQGALVRLTGEAARAALRDEYKAALARFPVHDFIFAFARAREPNLEWREFGPELDVFGPAYLPGVLMTSCEPATDPRYVNSIARPTLPRPRLLMIPRMP
jgi:hypothetical protein